MRNSITSKEVTKPSAFHSSSILKSCTNARDCDCLLVSAILGRDLEILQFRDLEPVGALKFSRGPSIAMSFQQNCCAKRNHSLLNYNSHVIRVSRKFIHRNFRELVTSKSSGSFIFFVCCLFRFAGSDIPILIIISENKLITKKWHQIEWF